MSITKKKLIKTNYIKPRMTSQQKIIVDYLKGVTIHPSAEKIYKEVRRKLPQISLGTVYRNLNMLREKAEILEIPTKTARYDGNTSMHAHYICDACGEIYDVFDPEINEICSIKKMEETEKNFKFGKIRTYQIYLYGVCRKCEG